MPRKTTRKTIGYKNRLLKQSRLVNFSLFGVIAVFVLTGIFIISGSHADNCKVSSKLVPSCGAWFGSFEGSSPSDVTERESVAGRKLDIVHFYKDWSATFPTSAEINLAQGNRFLFYDISAAYFSGGGVCWDAIANGSQDAAINAKAASIKAYGKPLFISFHHEMDSAVGSCDPSGGTFGAASDYVAAYRHIHDLFAADGVTNVIWDWVVTGHAEHDSEYLSLYPGDNYVDWIGWDPYNWYSCLSKPWLDFAQTASPFYDWLTQNSSPSHNFGSKPYMIAETGTPEEAGNLTAKGNWFANIPSQIQSQLPNIKAVVYFDQHSHFTVCDWHFDTSLYSLAGYKFAGSSAFFSQLHPSTTPTPTKTPVATPTPTHTPTHTPTPKPTPSPTPEPTASNSPTPTPSPSGSGGSGGSGTGIIQLASPTQPTTVTVDGTPFQTTQGALNTTYLTNGVHTVVVTENGKTTSKIIDVHNKLNPFQMLRNFLFARLAANHAVMNLATILIIIAPLLILAFIFKSRLAALIKRLLPARKAAVL